MHLIFSTKDRLPWLREPALRAEVHTYLGGVSKQLDCPAIIIGGVEEHIHVLSHLGRTISQAEWVKELKRVSSVWIKKQDPQLEGFQWQAGYGVFSVSPSHIDRVKKYIETQEEHHRHVSFQDEFRLFMKRHRLNWDERYVWD
jgi:REP element-mobilizing transposase RayT